MMSLINVPGLRHTYSSAIVRHADPNFFRKYTENQIFRSNGAGSEKLHVVLSGFAKTSILTEAGDEGIIGFVMPGDILDLINLAPYTTSSGSVSSQTVFLTDALVAECPLEEAMRLEMMLGGLGEGIGDLISRELRRLQWRNCSVRYASANTRVAHFLLEMGRRFSEINFSSQQFRLFMPRDDIAVFLGMTKCTLSRALHALSKRGLIDIDGRWIVIRDRAALSRL